MKKFSFNLESLLNTKLIQEKEQKKELSEIEQRLFEQQQQLEKVRQEIAELCRSWQAQMAAGANPASIQQFNNSYSHYLEQQNIRQNQLRSIEQEKELFQAKLIILLTEIKSLENLKKQQMDSYKIEMFKEMENEMGEFVSFHRKPVLTVGN